MHVAACRPGTQHLIVSSPYGDKLSSCYQHGALGHPLHRSQNCRRAVDLRGAGCSQRQQVPGTVTECETQCAAGKILHPTGGFNASMHIARLSSECLLGAINTVPSTDTRSGELLFSGMYLEICSMDTPREHRNDIHQCWHELGRRCISAVEDRFGNSSA